MKVILLENLRKIGSIGDVIDVKRGFARNYLIADKKALYASKKNIEEVKKIKSELGYYTIHKPQESVELIASALESGLINNRILHESVNIKPEN